MPFIETDKEVNLDLACGDNKFSNGWIGVDLDSPQADLKMDLEIYPWAFDSDSVDKIHCSHYLEHIENVISFMNEVYRILKMGGTARFISPYYTSVRAWQDPTHVRAISREFFDYFSEEWRRSNLLSHYPIKTNFKVEKVEYKFYPGFSEYLHKYEMEHQWNIVKDIDCTLVKA